LPRVIIVTDSRRQSPLSLIDPFVHRGLPQPRARTRGPFSAFTYSLLSRIKALCTRLYFLSSNINLIYLSLSGLEFRLLSTSPLPSVLGTRHSVLRLRCGTRSTRNIFSSHRHLSRPLLPLYTSGFVLPIYSFDSIFGTRLGLNILSPELNSVLSYRLRPCPTAFGLVSALSSSKSRDILV